MFRNLTLRAKLLIGVALLCAGYVALSPGASETVEPARGSDGSDAVRSAPHVIRPARGKHEPRLVNAAYHPTDRIVNDTNSSSLFSPWSWYVAPPAAPPAPVVYQPPPPPTAPPLPFAYMGSYLADGTATYFLTSGDRVYDVKVGDTLDNIYSVDGVKAGQLLLTYIPLKIQQSIAVGDEK